MKMDLVAWGGLVLLLAIAVLGFLEARGFRRTNPYGVQEFSGYFHWLWCRLFEGVLRIVAILAIPSGLLLVTMDFPKHMKEARAAQAAKAAKAASGTVAAAPGIQSEKRQALIRQLQRVQQRSRDLAHPDNLRIARRD